MSSPGPGGGGSQFRPIGKAAPVSRKERDAANNTRPMALKVLYSFDSQNNSNCLARWPETLSIRTAAIDERTVIGVVDLKTCIQAVVQSSPELISRLGQDYTVYAYDYSEFDVPQSGQGMLSWALAAEAASQLVTGRVCKNVLGLFSSGVQETLEVKLRLVPVTTVEQNEYLSTMERSRQQSNQSDNNEWKTLMNSQPGLQQMPHTFSAQTVSANQRDVVSREEFNHILNPSSSIGGPNLGIAKAGSRASTPTARGKGKGSQAKTSRPSSRTGVKRPRGRPTKKSAGAGNISGSEDVGTDGDDGPSRKRIRPSEAEHDGSSTFGDPESLRIRASTAASIRGDLRPKPVNPAMSAGNGLQELPRAPTPVPKLPPQISTRGSGLLKSSLRRESLPSPGGTRPYISPYSDAPIDSGLGSEQVHLSIESAMTSPECHDSPAQTPQDIASSPPVLSTSLRPSMPPPSSPILPQMPRREDSTYGGSGGLFGDEDDDDMCLIEVDGDGNGLNAGQGAGTLEGELQGTPQDRPPPNILPGPVSKPMTPRPEGSPAASVRSCDGQTLPPHKDQIHSQRNSPYPQEQFDQISAVGATSSKVTAASAALSMPELLPNFSIPKSDNNNNNNIYNKRAAPVRAASFSSLTLPSASAPSGDMSFPPPSLARSQTAAPLSTTSDRDESESLEKEDETLGRNIAKKARILSKLEQAVAKGELPDFCSNCGAIETPTWRKAFTQDLHGDPGFIEYSDEPGQIMAVTILERDGAGKAISYRIFKKSLAVEESFGDFKEVMLCNPCGIWVAKYKSHRPKENWAIPQNPNARIRKPRVRGKRRSQKKEQPAQPTSEAHLQSEAYFPSDFQSEANFPQSEAPGTGFSPTPVDGGDDSRGQSVPGGSQAQPALSMYQQHESNFTVMTATAVGSLSGRASPNQMREGSRHSPMPLAAEFGSTRRLLFQSPRKDGSPRILGEPEVNVIVRVPVPATSFRSPKEHLGQNNAEEVSDKENQPPRDGSYDSSISALFGEESPARPKTPTQSNTPLDPFNPFKTPTRPTPSHRPITRSQSRSVSAKKAKLSNQTPSRRSPRNQEDLIETPMTYFNRLFSQPDLQVNLDPMVPATGSGFGDALDFSMPDMKIHFDLFDDNDASYIQPNDDMWNDDVQYDILGGHGTPPDNEYLARLLSGRAEPEHALNASGILASSEDSGNQAARKEMPQEANDVEGNCGLNAKQDGDEMNGVETTQDTNRDDVPQTQIS